MSLVDKIRKDMFSFAKNGDSVSSQILKMVLASVKNEEIKKGGVLEDIEIEKVLRMEIKKIKDAIEQYEKMGREDLKAEEERQLDVLKKYLPELISEEEIRKVVEAKASEMGITSMSDMGRLMGAVMKDLNGRADGALVRQIVQEVLS